MLNKLTDSELDFIENFYNPIAQAECLFSDFDNLGAMEGEQLSHIRLGQVPLLSFEYMIDDKNQKLTKKENFQLRKGSGDSWSLGGRMYGKTKCLLQIDLIIALIILNNEQIGFSSYDLLHIQGPLEPVLQALEVHPLLKLFQFRPAKIKRNPYEVYMKNGNHLIGINMNVLSKAPGRNFFGKHMHRLYIEEASFESRAVYEQRRDSQSEKGCIFRCSGMTNFTKYDPCGVIYDDLDMRRRYVINLPQYCNPNWSAKMKEDAIKDFGGENSFPFRIFIRGEVVELGETTFDMTRIRCYYDENRKTKSFEISKDSYHDFKNIIIVERLKNAEAVYICADIGDGGAPSEIGIFFQINNQYRYEYNITLYGLTDDEQYVIFRWLGERLNAEFISIDTSEGTGRAIFRELTKVFPKETMIWVAFQDKIAVDYEKNEKGEIILKDGEPVYKEEFVSEWSVKHLRDLLYTGRILLPQDYKIDSQLNAIRTKMSGQRVTYVCILKDNHAYQMLQVMSIAQWNTEFLNVKNLPKKPYFKSGV